MKLFKNIKKWLENQEHLFYLFLFILIVPNALFYGAAVVYSKGLQCPVTFWMLLPANDTIEKLR